MITTERTKELFVSLRMHFTSDKYDFMRYHGKIRKVAVKYEEILKISQLQNRFSEEDDMIRFFIAAMTTAYMEEGFIPSYLGEYVNKSMFWTYDKWSAWWSAAEYNFQQDLIKANLPLRELIEIKDGGHPKVFDLLISGEFSLNSVLCLEAGTNTLLPYWRKKTDDTVLFLNYVKFMGKYKTLMTIDGKKMQEIIKSQAVS